MAAHPCQQYQFCASSTPHGVLKVDQGARHSCPLQTYGYMQHMPLRTRTAQHVSMTPSILSCIAHMPLRMPLRKDMVRASTQSLWTPKTSDKTAYCSGRRSSASTWVACTHLSHPSKHSCSCFNLKAAACTLGCVDPASCIQEQTLETAPGQQGATANTPSLSQQLMGALLAPWPVQCRLHGPPQRSAGCRMRHPAQAAQQCRSRRSNMQPEPRAGQACARSSSAALRAGRGTG